jgi:hypothetical protein
MIKNEAEHPRIVPRTERLVAREQHLRRRCLDFAIRRLRKRQNLVS